MMYIHSSKGQSYKAREQVTRQGIPIHSCRYSKLLWKRPYKLVLRKLASGMFRSEIAGPFCRRSDNDLKTLTVKLEIAGTRSRG